MQREFPRYRYHYISNQPRILRGANASTLSNKNPENKRRELVILSALIEYPGVGLILFETGCAEDLDVVCCHA